MIIHVVQQGETINSIAEKYGIETDRLIQDNGLMNLDNLAVGQTIVIVNTKQVYTVKEGDTLQGIADTFGISLIQLLRNNPNLLDREFIFPGDTLVTQYEDEKVAKIITNGYVFPYVEPEVLKKSLLYLTYLSVFSYSVTSDGELNDIDDIHIINLAKSFGVAPIMVISNERETGDGSVDITHNMIVNQEIKNNFINNILSVLHRKGYYAVSIDIPNIQSEDRNLFINLMEELTERLHSEGFKVFLTITPTTFEQGSGITTGELDNSILSQTIDGLVLLSYDWAYPSNVLTASIPFYFIKYLVAYFASLIPSEKIIIGTSTIGYIGELPYIKGISRVSMISYTNAVLLASEENAAIQYDEVNLSTFFYLNKQKLSIVVFHDARGINTYMQLIPELGLQGLGIWNVMYYNQQANFMVNTQYDIINISF